ncbi:MAG: sodium:solute symporter family transporter [Candidatus Oleimicrobiaceae bacterium]
MHYLSSSDYYALLFYGLLLVGIGVYFSRFMKGAKEFFAGGNMIPWWVSGVSLYMGNFTAWTFTGAAGFVYHTGLFGVIYFLTWSVAFFIGYRITAARWRRARVVSPVEYTTTRYNAPTRQLVGYVMVLSGLLSRGITLTAVSKIIASTVGVPIEWVIVAAGVVILLYTMLGGLWAVTIADVVQFLILLAVSAVVMPLSLQLVGGLGALVAKLPPLQLSHAYSGLEYDIHYLVAITLFNIINANWAPAQRYYSVKDEKEAKKVGLLGSMLFLTVPLLFGVPPLVASILWPDLGKAPFFVDQFKPEDLVFVGIVLQTLPKGLIGFFLVAMFAATLSTINAGYNLDSSVISRDLYAGLINRRASDRQVLLVGRLATVFLGLVTMITAIIYAKSSLGIFNLMVVFLSLFYMPLAIPLAFGLVFKSLPRWSAANAVVLGTLTSAVTRFVLHWPVGFQLYATIGVTFAALFLARPLARLHQRNAAVSALVAILWVGLMAAGVLSATPVSKESSALVLLAACAFAAALYWFVVLFARETIEDRREVESFFARLDTPVDVQREVYGAGKRIASSFPLVGRLAFAVGVVVFLQMLDPVCRDALPVRLAVGGMLVGTGALFVFLDKRSERHSPLG